MIGVMAFSLMRSNVERNLPGSRSQVLTIHLLVMSRQVNLRLAHTKTALVNLPPILASQLSSQGILPQSLAVELTQVVPTNTKQTRARSLCVGWSGLTTFSNNDRFPNPRSSSHQNKRTTTSSLWGTSLKNAPTEFIESVELDHSLAAHLGWKDSDRLAIKFFHRDLPIANTVNVEPLTVDDWEILESNPQNLEDNILKQIRVVVESQQLLIWVYDKTLIKVKVTSILPTPTHPKGDGSYAPYLITNQTEVIVRPKSRFDSSIQDSDKKKDILGSEDTPSKQKKNTTQHKPIDLKILPQAFPIDTNQVITNDGDDQPIALINTLQMTQVEEKFPTMLCCLELLVRPNQAINSKNSSSLASSSEIPTRLKNSKTPHKNLSPTNFVDRVRIVSHPDVPEGFIWLSRSFLLKSFASLLPTPDLKSSFLVSRPGDYEYLRIGPSKITGSEFQSSDSNENNGPSVDQDHPIESKTEEVILLGFSEHLGFCKQYIHTSLVTSQLFSHSQHQSGSHSLSGLMICGSSGSGKTSLVKTLIEKIYLDRQVMMYCRYIDCGKQVDDRLGVLKANITEWFDDAAWHSPSVLVLDDLDQLLPAEAEHLDSFRYRHFTEEFLSIAKMATKDKLVMLVATSKNSSAIHKLLRSSTHTFSETLELKGLSRNNRKEILAELVKLKAKKSGLDISRVKPDLLCSEKTEGYLPSDLKDLVDRAVHQAIIRSLKISHQIQSKPVSLEMVDFETALSGFVPISLRDIKLQKSGVNWEDVGGLTETRRILRETLEWPTKYPSVFANCPLRLRSGLLLYGYPGCGKTLLASAIAKECGLNFINIKGPELLNKYIGASEQSVRDLFQRAQAAKPCVLFFDEFESIAPKRGHDSTGVTDRVVNQLLTQMDGAEGLEGVYVLAATSRPDLIDPALLRPGRLDKSLLCSMPTVEERHDILKAVSRKLPLDSDLSFEELAKMTEGFTGADLQALIYSAHLQVVHESIHATKTLSSQHENLLPQQQQEEEENKSNGLESRDKKITWTRILPSLDQSIPSSSSSSKLNVNGVVQSLAENESLRKRIEQVLDNSSSNKLSLRKLNENKKSLTTTQDSSPNLIEMRHIRSALRNARPSVPATELARLTKIYRNFVSSRSDGGLPDGEASDEIGGRASLM